MLFWKIFPTSVFCLSWNKYTYHIHSFSYAEPCMWLIVNEVVNKNEKHAFQYLNMNIMKLARIFFSIIITLTTLGLIANITSISYFIKSEKKGLPNKLMICLNFTNVIASLTLIVYYIFDLVIYIYEPVTGNAMIVLCRNAELVVTAIFNTACIISGCLTFGLTLLRTIVIYNPFYRVKQKLCVSGLIVLLVALIALMQILAFWTYLLPLHYRKFIICGVMTAILSCCNIFMSSSYHSCVKIILS